MNIIQYLRKYAAILQQLHQSNSRNSILFLLLGCMVFMQAQSQNDKNYQLAEQYFAAGEYLTAAGLYEQFLNPPVKSKANNDFPLFANRHGQSRTGKQIDKLDVLYKQAESYRLANYWPQASARYKECFEKDNEKYATGLYWYAASQRSIGNYKEAEESLQSFLGIAEENSYHRQATQELETLQFIRQQLARPDSILYRAQKINTKFGNEKGVYAPVLISDSKLLLTSAVPDTILKIGANPYHNRLFLAGLVNGNIENMEELAIPGLDVSMDQGAATISGDGRHLYFTQWKKVNGRNISSVYHTSKSESGWSMPVSLPLNVENFSSKQPHCSAEGKFLFFSSDRPGGSGNFDIWLAPLQADGTTGEPVNAGNTVNTSSDEQSPFFHPGSNSLVFASNRAAGMGGYDLYAAKGEGTNWEVPANLGYPVNSSRDDQYFYSEAGRSLLANAIVSSDRGSDCCLELYSIKKNAKERKLQGNILDCRTNEPLAGATVILKNSRGDSVQTITAEDGNYEFLLPGNITGYQFVVRKDFYKDLAGPVSIRATDESGWLTDILMSIPLCVEKKLVIKVENVVTVYFDFDKSDLKDRGLEQLDSIYAILNENPAATLQISGYTDGLGSVEYNIKLSDRRAKACADYLVSKGIDSTRISFESFGACCPIEMELLNGRDNPDGRSKNRRALINISKE